MSQRGIAEPFQRDKFVARPSFRAIQCANEVRQPIFCSDQIRWLRRSSCRSGDLQLFFHRRKCNPNRIGIRLPARREFGISPLLTISAMKMYFALVPVGQYLQLTQKIEDFVLKF